MKMPNIGVDANTQAKVAVSQAKVAVSQAKVAVSQANEMVISVNNTTWNSTRGESEKSEIYG